MVISMVMMMVVLAVMVIGVVLAVIVIGVVLAVMVVVGNSNEQTEGEKGSRH